MELVFHEKYNDYKEKIVLSKKSVEFDVPQHAGVEKAEYLNDYDAVSKFCLYKNTPQTQDVNWTYIRRSDDVLDVFWTSYVHTIYVLCLQGRIPEIFLRYPDRFKNIAFWILLYKKIGFPISNFFSKKML